MEDGGERRHSEGGWDLRILTQWRPSLYTTCIIFLAGVIYLPRFAPELLTNP